MVQILLADYQPEFRLGLKNALERQPDFQIVGEAGNAQETLTLCREIRADILLMDTLLPDAPLIIIIQQILETRPDIRIILMGDHDDPTLIREVIQSGICGYVIKEEAAGNYEQIIRTVLAGNILISQRVLEILNSTAELSSEPVLDTLTDRELDVLRWMAKGYSNQKIADQLNISEGTVKNHVTAIYQKLGTASRVQTIIKALDCGINQYPTAGKRIDSGSEEESAGE